MQKQEEKVKKQRIKLRKLEGKEDELREKEDAKRERRDRIATLERLIERDRESVKRYEKKAEETEKQIRDEKVKWEKAVTEPINAQNTKPFLAVLVQRYNV